MLFRIKTRLPNCIQPYIQPVNTKHSCIELGLFKPTELYVQKVDGTYLTKLDTYNDNPKPKLKRDCKYAIEALLKKKQLIAIETKINAHLLMEIFAKHAEDNYHYPIHMNSLVCDKLAYLLHHLSIMCNASISHEFIDSSEFNTIQTITNSPREEGSRFSAISLKQSLIRCVIG